MKAYAYTQDLNTSEINPHHTNLNCHLQTNNEAIEAEKDYHHSVAIITTLQELIEIEETKIFNYLRLKKI